MSNASMYLVQWKFNTPLTSHVHCPFVDGWSVGWLVEQSVIISLKVTLPCPYRRAFFTCMNAGATLASFISTEN